MVVGVCRSVFKIKKKINDIRGRLRKWRAVAVFVVATAAAVTIVSGYRYIHPLHNDTVRKSKYRNFSNRDRQISATTYNTLHVAPPSPPTTTTTVYAILSTLAAPIITYLSRRSDEQQSNPILAHSHHRSEQHVPMPVHTIQRRNQTDRQTDEKQKKSTREKNLCTIKREETLKCACKK